jgi:hypothetical protein
MIVLWTDISTTQKTILYIMTQSIILNYIVKFLSLPLIRIEKSPSYMRFMPEFRVKRNVVLDSNNVILTTTPYKRPAPPDFQLDGPASIKKSK